MKIKTKQLHHIYIFHLNTLNTLPVGKVHYILLNGHNDFTLNSIIQKLETIGYNVYQSDLYEDGNTI